MRSENRNWGAFHVKMSFVKRVIFLTKKTPTSRNKETTVLKKV